jgi:hypothetical protein
MASDYGYQLNQIVQALTRPTPWWQHPWILAGLASMLGVMGGFAGQLLLLRYTNWRKLRTMRKLVYSDIVELFTVVDTALNFPFEKVDSLEDAQSHRRAYFKLIAPRMSEDYIKANPEIFAGMGERIPAEGIYSFHRHLLSEPDQFDGYLRSVNQIIAGHFKKDRLTMKNVRKYVGKEAAETFKPRLAPYQDGV